MRQYVPDLFAGEEKARLRTTLEVDRGKLLSWAVQLEWWDPEEEDWVWVVRYDTAGGRVHRDRNRIAAHEPVLLPLPVNSGQAVNWAKDDLRQRAQEYIQDYRAAKGPEE